MIVILIGAPGSGKGTQAKRLCESFGFKHLATGDMFRSEIARGSDLGKRAQDYVRAGRLVPDVIVTEMVAAYVEADGKYLLDGFPRNIVQAQSLAALLKSHSRSIDLVCCLSLNNEEAVRRMTSRRICSGCGEVYNIGTRPPKTADVCDKCGAKVIQREDDSEATCRKRQMVFEDLTQPLVAYYKAEHLFHDIDASQSPDKVETALRAVIESAKAAR